MPGDSTFISIGIRYCCQKHQKWDWTAELSFMGHILLLWGCPQKMMYIKLPDHPDHPPQKPNPSLNCWPVTKLVTVGHPRGLSDLLLKDQGKVSFLCYMLSQKHLPQILAQNWELICLYLTTFSCFFLYVHSKVQKVLNSIFSKARSIWKVYKVEWTVELGNTGSYSLDPNTRTSLNGVRIDPLQELVNRQCELDPRIPLKHNEEKTWVYVKRTSHEWTLRI